MISVIADSIVFLLRQVPPEKMHALFMDVFNYLLNAIDKL